MTRKILGVVLMIILPFLFIPNQASGQTKKEIIVSSAISLTNAFEEIGRIFQERQKNIRVLFNFGASGDLARQIIGGAPVDIFVSAGSKEMDDLNNRNLILKETRIDFAQNEVVLILPAGAGSQLTSYIDLKKKAIKRIAIGNPMTVPAGRYSEEVLKYFHLLDEIRDKLIFAENARQVLDYVARGEVDAGMVYSTDAAVRTKEVKIIAEAPRESHSPIFYSLAVLKETEDRTRAMEFISFVLSKEGKKILEKYGFRVLKAQSGI